MSLEKCKVCFDLDETSMVVIPWQKSIIHYYPLRHSASTCRYCKILFDGITHAISGNKTPSFSFAIGNTLRLTMQDLMLASGIERTIEYYRNNLHASEAVNTSPGATEQTSSASAIKFRARPTQFWDESVRLRLQQWTGASLVALLPRRILDLGDDGVPLRNSIQLLEPEAVYAPYVTLSHCWVNREVLTTTTANLHTHIKHISFDSLPQTFQEAIKICRWLNIRYLWIDSLCIIQDDLVDWEQQAARMDSIYENAFFTMAAHGHAGSSMIPTYNEWNIPTELPGLQDTICARDIPFHSFLSPVGVVMGSVGQEAPDEISGRGWCYQERLLSRQILHFTQTEVLHEDHRGRIKCQCDDQIPHGFCVAADRRPTLTLSKSPSKQWREIVKQYSQKTFTRTWDILPGLSGIARRFHQEHTLGDYLAGLWSRDLLRWLCWKSVRIALWGAVSSGCDRCGIWPRRLTELAPRAQYIIPTFSWASRIGGCEYLNKVWDDAYQQVSEIKSTCFESTPESPFGRFNMCSLKISGPVKDMTVLSTVNKDRKYTSGCRTEYAYLFDPTVYESLCLCNLDEQFEQARLLATRFDFDAVDDIPADGKLVTVMELFREAQSSVALVLARSSDNHGNVEGPFHRVGICMGSTRSIGLHAAHQHEIILA
ncbi:unnamed protein product [Clonostachys solani]|uniref:Heterokaryon incompatibility domain-containing protein n=1 Tax=Clonostachys solani TaxID=160281 RepID=A0A9N9YY61_9HYPO|nr:unnamed protein product [Clonostachys solani]